MASFQVALPKRTSIILLLSLLLFKPEAVVAFPWGSISMIRICFSARLSDAPRLTAVVVFPTPPF